MAWECGEVPGLKLMDAVDGMIGDAFKHMAQVDSDHEPILGSIFESVYTVKGGHLRIFRTGYDFSDEVIHRPHPFDRRVAYRALCRWPHCSHRAGATR